MPPALEERGVEANEGRDRPENPEQFGIEPGRGGELRLELAAGEELLEPKVARGWMVLRVATRHAGQLLAAERADGARKGAARDDAMEPAVTARDVLPNQPKVG